MELGALKGVSNAISIGRFAQINVVFPVHSLERREHEMFSKNANNKAHTPRDLWERPFLNFQSKFNGLVNSQTPSSHVTGEKGNLKLQAIAWKMEGLQSKASKWMFPQIH